MHARPAHTADTPTADTPTAGAAPAAAPADAQAHATDAVRRYLEPGWFTRHVANPMMRGLTRVGLSVRGSRELRVRGRTSGEWRATPVNPLHLGAAEYLVAPRGRTEWVRNLEVRGEGELRLGRRVETFRAEAVADDDKPAILREYLRRWRSEVGVFFDGVDADATDEQLRAIASGYPVFRIRPVAA
jgi:hypothetical protein